jgi:hypothetical protein
LGTSCTPELSFDEAQRARTRKAKDYRIGLAEPCPSVGEGAAGSSLSRLVAQMFSAQRLSRYTATGTTIAAPVALGSNSLRPAA